MKKRNLLLTAMLFCVTMSFAQQLEFQDLTPARKRPKELSHSITTIIAPYGDDLLCAVIVPKMPVPGGKMVILDKQLDVVKEITLPEQYKKYSYTLLSKIGNRYIISIYKGLKDRLLGLMDENFQLIKTYQLSHKYTFEREIYKTDDYAILNVNGLELIKVDADLNVLQTGYLSNKFNLYLGSWNKLLNNGLILIRKPEYMCLLNPETLETVSEIELPKPYLSDERVGSTYVLDGDEVFGSIRSFKFNWEVWKDLMWTHEDFSGDWKYVATLYDRNGKKLQECTLQAEGQPNKSCVEQYCNAVWDKHNSQMIIARAWQNCTLTKGAKTTEKTVEGHGKLTLYTLSKNSKETKHIENLKIDFPLSSVQILNTDEDNVYVLLGGKDIISLVSVNMKTLAYENLLTKQIEGTLGEHFGMYTNDAGYCLISNNIQVNTKKAGSSTFYDCESTEIFISKDMKKFKSYHTLYLADDNTVHNSICTNLCRPNMFVIQHEKPEGKIISGKDLYYDIIDDHGNRQTVPTGLHFFRGVSQPVQITPNEYYLLYDYETKTFKLCKLTLNPG